MCICLTNIIQFYKMLGTYIKIIKTLCVSVHTHTHMCTYTKVSCVLLQWFYDYTQIKPHRQAV